MLFNSKGITTTLLGTCPYGTKGMLPKNVTHVSEDPSLCSFFNRKGQLCGECAENYTLPAYSYHLGCVKSYEFLIPSQLYDVDGNNIHKAYWYYDGRVDMTSKSYLPYLVLALFMLLFFNVFPLALLALYPFKCFQRFLEICLSQNCRIMLHIYMDSFYGCYEDNTSDYRHFATLYLAVRFLHLLMSSVFNYSLYLPAAALLFVFTLALVAKFQPYKCKRNNTVDIILLLVMIS